MMCSEGLSERCPMRPTATAALTQPPTPAPRPSGRVPPSRPFPRHLSDCVLPSIPFHRHSSENHRTPSIVSSAPASVHDAASPSRPPWRRSSQQRARAAELRIAVESARPSIAHSSETGFNQRGAGRFTSKRRGRRRIGQSQPPRRLSPGAAGCPARPDPTTCRRRRAGPRAPGRSAGARPARVACSRCSCAAPTPAAGRDGR